MKPIIGISTTIIDSKEYKEKKNKHLNGLNMSRVPVDYSNAIERAGGIPFLLPVLKYATDEVFDEIISKLDGIIFTGGEDIDPYFYNKNYEKQEKGIMKPNRIRDEYEFNLLKSAFKLNIPILGICRGIQLLNVHFGGTLYNDINLEYETTINHLAPLDCKYKKIHEIIIDKNSKLFEVYNKTKIEVNSFHHQGIKKVAKQFKVSAKATDSMVESIEYEGNNFILGLQFHPEMMFENDEEQLNVFKYFVKKVKCNN